jgi:hypothetical protein
MTGGIKDVMLKHRCRRWFVRWSVDFRRTVPSKELNDPSDDFINRGIGRFTISLVIGFDVKLFKGALF